MEKIENQDGNLTASTTKAVDEEYAIVGTYSPYPDILPFINNVRYIKDMYRIGKSIGKGGEGTTIVSAYHSQT